MDLAAGPQRVGRGFTAPRRVRGFGALKPRPPTEPKSVETPLHGVFSLEFRHVTRGGPPSSAFVDRYATFPGRRRRASRSRGAPCGGAALARGRRRGAFR